MFDLGKKGLRVDHFYYTVHIFSCWKKWSLWTLTLGIALTHKCHRIDIGQDLIVEW